MKKTPKRIAAFAMSLLMTLSMIPTTAFAAEVPVNITVDSVTGAPTAISGEGWEYDAGSKQLTLDAGNSYTFVGGEVKANVINNGSIDGGTFGESVVNNGNLVSGTFNGTVNNKGYIVGGLYQGDVLNNAEATIHNGTFEGEISNLGVIDGGDLNGLISDNAPEGDIETVKVTTTLLEKKGDSATETSTKYAVVGSTPIVFTGSRTGKAEPHTYLTSIKVSGATVAGASWTAVADGVEFTWTQPSKDISIEAIYTNTCNHTYSTTRSDNCLDIQLCSVCEEEFAKHDFTEEVEAEKYLASAATCVDKSTYYFSCECGEADPLRTFEGSDELLAHVYDKEVADEKYLASETTCTEQASYYKSCECGAIGEETFKSGKTLPHIHNRKVESPEFLASAATCTEKATYYFSCDCGHCGTELFESSSECAPHVFDKESTDIAHRKANATCTTAVEYYKSCVCGANGPETFFAGEKLPHTFDKEIADEKYLASEATCTAKATYYKSCECGEAGEETFESGELKAHTYSEQNTDEKYLATEATCTAKATYFFSCVCGAAGEETFEAGELKAHEYSQSVEDEKFLATAATCTTSATYYKSCLCGAIGEETFDSAVAPVHVSSSDIMGEWEVVKPSTNDAAGEMIRYCTVEGCGYSETREIAIGGVPAVLRLAGDDRYATANAISSKGFATAENVIIASGKNYPDALAGVPLAYALNAPVLLVGDTIDDETLEQIEVLGAQNAYLLGGSDVVSDDIAYTLIDRGMQATRVYGDDRFCTAVAIATLLEEKVEAPADEIFLAYAYNYPDALAAGNVAALKGCPILYIKADGTLTPETAEYIANSGASKVTILGGFNAISKDAEVNIAEITDATISRVYGATRYETCLAINETYADVFTGKDICVATGNNYPDALSGGAFAAVMGSPMVLIDNELNEAQKDYIDSINPETCYVFGGSDVVPENIVEAIRF